MARNVAGLVAGPKVQRGKSRPLTPAEAAQLFAAAAEDRLSPATTSDLCTHLLEPVQRAAADRMDDLLRQVTPGSGA